MSASVAHGEGSCRSRLGLDSTAELAYLCVLTLFGSAARGRRSAALTMVAQRKIWVSIVVRTIVCVVLLVGAVGLFRLLASTRPMPAPSDARGAAPRIIVMHAQPVPVRRQWSGFGTALAMDSANVPSRVTATVIERPEESRPGRTVTRGQVIVRLDDSDFVRQVEIASQSIEDIAAQLLRLDVEQQSWTRRADLAAQDVTLAQAEDKRVREAFEREAANQRELDAARQALNSAEQALVAAREELDSIVPRRASLEAKRVAEQASLRLAKQNVERSVIVSPLDGVLQSVDVEEGENITAGQRVARVVNPLRIEVPLLLPASSRPFVSIGDEVTLTDAGAGSHAWTARVTRIAPEDDDSTRTLRAFVEVRQEPNGRTLLAPGKFVQGPVTSG